jgi:amino acid/amide ABC transporter membrane protein 1, HAAT family (TC 3.A.1.4.-)/amino acid/amide ABC transporter membrane protein 2, HAAT family (TC 3.A.1.4.-)
MPDFALRTLTDQFINGLVIGNVYALIAIGLALIFGVANLINFAHGSVYMVGAYVGWVAVMWLGWPLAPTFVAVAVVCAVLGGYRARIRNHGHSCFLCEIVIRSQFHTTYEPEA